MIMAHESFGFDSKDTPTRLSFVLTGIWWIVFSQYTYRYLPKGNARKPSHKNWMFNGFQELLKIYRNVKTAVVLRRYLAAFFIYSMGVQTIMLIATYFGIEELTGESKMPPPD